MKKIFYLLFILCFTSKTMAAESWYFAFGLGTSSVNYGGEAKENLDTIKRSGDFNSGAGAITSDLMGFYFPTFSPSTISGLVFNYIFDNYQSDNYNGTDEEASLAFQLGQIMLSNIHYWGADPGSGWFMRTDLGVGSISWRISLSDPSDNLEGKITNGLSYNLGAGYGMAVTQRVNITFTFLMGVYSDPRGNSTFSSLMMGALF